MSGRVFVVIIATLNSKPKVTATELAQKLEVSERSVYRYLDELTVSGIPINVERGRYGGFFLDEEYRNSRHKITV